MAQGIRHSVLDEGLDRGRVSHIRLDGHRLGAARLDLFHSNCSLTSASAC